MEGEEEMEDEKEREECGAELEGEAVIPEGVATVWVATIYNSRGY